LLPFIFHPETTVEKMKNRRESLDAHATEHRDQDHVASVEALIPKAAAIADRGPIEIIQDDTFFACEAGRLKLRVFSKEQGELVFYRRANQQGPKESFYLRSPIFAPDTLRECLSLAYGQAGRVQKHRTLFLVGRTRVHLDRVAHLGHFLELEVVLEGDEPSELGVREAHELMAKLGVEPSQLIEGTYIDLLAKTRLTFHRAVSHRRVSFLFGWLRFSHRYHATIHSPFDAATGYWISLHL
jgi:adenylate cyclase class IV